jgi:hypothetical protein
LRIAPGHDMPDGAVLAARVQPQSEATPLPDG